MSNGDYGSGMMGNSNNMMMPMGSVGNNGFSTGNSLGGPMMQQGAMSNNFNNNSSSYSSDFGSQGMGGGYGSGGFDRGS